MVKLTLLLIAVLFCERSLCLAQENSTQVSASNSVMVRDEYIAFEDGTTSGHIKIYGVVEYDLEKPVNKTKTIVVYLSQSTTSGMTTISKEEALGLPSLIQKLEDAITKAPPVEHNRRFTVKSKSLTFGREVRGDKNGGSGFIESRLAGGGFSIFYDKATLGKISKSMVDVDKWLDKQ